MFCTTVLLKQRKFLDKVLLKKLPLPLKNPPQNGSLWQTWLLQTKPNCSGDIFDSVPTHSLTKAVTVSLSTAYAGFL